MQKKNMISIFVCILLIAVSVSSVTGTIDENEIYDMKNDDYNNLIKQAFESGVISTDDWLEQDKLLASDGAEDDEFGVSVSISGDYAIIGAYGDDDNGDGSGSAYVFKRSGTTWVEEAKLLASDGAEYDCFGLSVSISGDYAIIGAFGDDDNGEWSGSAYVFKRDGTAWIEQDKLVASDGAADDEFGLSVSISGDYAIIGAYGDDDNGDGSGSAYVFKRDGTAWTEQDKLLASDGAKDDYFGISVSIDGDYAIIGAHGNDDNGSSSGSTYVFERCVPDLSFIIKGGLGARIVITNNATEDINDVEWEVQAEAGILGMINKTAFGTIDVPAEDSVPMGTGLLFGLGGIDIKATVDGEEKTATGTQIIILTLVS